MSADFQFPAQSAEAPSQEFATPPVARETELEVPPVNASVQANQAEFEVPPSRATMPAYHRGPSYASEVDNLAEPQVLREDTILVSHRPAHLPSQLLFCTALLPGPDRLPRPLPSTSRITGTYPCTKLPARHRSTGWRALPLQMEMHAQA